MADPRTPSEKPLAETAVALISGLTTSCSPAEEDRVHFTTGFLSGYRHSTAIRIAAWLETLAKPGTQPADYYAQAADKLRRGEWIR